MGSNVFYDVRNETFGVTLEFLLVPFLTDFWPCFKIDWDWTLY